MQLTGIHHLTAISADAPGNLRFYTRTLGLRLVKKTVNQDDVSAYHLFYADGLASPGTDITFFDWPTRPERRGTRSIARTGLRVNASSLGYWRDRLAELKVAHGEIAEIDGRPTLEFADHEGQRLALVADESKGNAWDRSPVPAEHQIKGLGPITLSVPELSASESLLTQVMNLRKDRTFESKRATDGSDRPMTTHVYSTADGGPAAEIHVAVEPELATARHGAGGVHHVAFRVPTFADYDAWIERLNSFGIAHSGPVDRYYFRSIYFRTPDAILFELATDEPGFAADEPMDALGERLALPPFLEPRRALIEANLKPL